MTLPLSVPDRDRAWQDAMREADVLFMADERAAVLIEQMEAKDAAK